MTITDTPPWYSISHDDDRAPEHAPPRGHQHWDHDAEQGILGAILGVPRDERPTIAAALTPEDFTLHTNRLLWEAVTRLTGHEGALSPAIIAAELGPALDTVGHDTIRAIYQQASSLNWHAWVSILRHHTRTRRALAVVAELDHAIREGADWGNRLDKLEELGLTTDRTAEPSPDIDTILNSTDPEYDWVVPGLIERGDRVIVTGHEGHGKSTLLRQMGVTISAGLHPFTAAPIEPKRVLIIDLENSASQTRRLIRPLRRNAGGDLDPTNLRLECRPEGVDLLDRHDRDWFTERIAANQPDVLITGPIYKMASGDPKDEEAARAVATLFDQLRTHHGFALILEAHQPHASGQGSKRAIRPYGASLWMRWPEFGLHLAQGGGIQHFRGDRDAREWPAAVKRGGDWPWTAVTDAKTLTFARLMDIVAELGYVPSNRELAMSTGASQQTIGRSIKANQAQWDSFTATLDQEPAE